MRDKIYLLVDPRGHVNESQAYTDARYARERCAASNAMLRQKWGIVGVYWRVIACDVQEDARVINDKNS